MEDKKIMRLGPVLVTNSELSKHLFDKSPIWCEYYSPLELPELSKTGVGLEWLEEQLIRPIDENGMHPYYTVLGDFDYKMSTFLFVKCSIKISDDMEIYGCILVIEKVPNCITIFEPEEIDLYFNEDFISENNSSLNIIASYFNISINELISLKCKTFQQPPLFIKDFLISCIPNNYM